jgi:hypothetical protein
METPFSKTTQAQISRFNQNMRKKEEKNQVSNSDPSHHLGCTWTLQHQDLNTKVLDQDQSSAIAIS